MAFKEFLSRIEDILTSQPRDRESTHDVKRLKKIVGNAYAQKSLLSVDGYSSRPEFLSAFQNPLDTDDWRIKTLEYEIRDGELQPAGTETGQITFGGGYRSYSKKEAMRAIHLMENAAVRNGSTLVQSHENSEHFYKKHLAAAELVEMNDELVNQKSLDAFSGLLEDNQEQRDLPTPPTNKKQTTSFDHGKPFEELVNGYFDNGEIVSVNGVLVQKEMVPEIKSAYEEFREGLGQKIKLFKYSDEKHIKRLDGLAKNFFRVLAKSGADTLTRDIKAKGQESEALKHYHAHSKILGGTSWGSDDTISFKEVRETSRWAKRLGTRYVACLNRQIRTDIRIG